MEEQMKQPSSFAKGTGDKQAEGSKNSSLKEKDGDYIDFEEVK
jgi:hypothetical protein